MKIRRLLIGVLLLISLQAWAGEAPDLTAGIILIGQADYAAALTTLLPLAVNNPDDAELHYWLGRAYYGQRVYHLAAQHLAIAADRDARNLDYCRWHARALRKANALTDALAAYAVYLQRFPESNSLLSEYAATRAAVGDFPGARESFAQLLARDPSPATRATVDAWNALLDGLAKQATLEPPYPHETKYFTLRYAPHDRGVNLAIAEVEAARQQISGAFGLEVSGFRVLLFPTWSSYARYAHVLLPDYTALHAAAISLPGLLVLWSPGDWTTAQPVEDEFRGIVRHEMAHLAIAQRTHGEGIPTWLNEGLACYYGGWGGTASGQPPTPPFTLRALERAFTLGTPDETAQAYAQAFAMATVLVKQRGITSLLRLLDMLAAGAPLPDAYQQVCGEPLDTFLAEWPKRYREGNRP